MSQRTPQIFYSEKYTDDKYEYRHVVLPKDMVKLLPTSRLMTEREWRSIGVQQSPGWIHYMVHMPEPWILLFKRPLSTTAEPAPMKTETKTTVASNTTTDTTTTKATTKAQPPKEKDKKAN